MSDLDKKWVILAPNGINPGLFKIRYKFCRFWLGESNGTKIYLIFLLKNAYKLYSTVEVSCRKFVDNICGN